MGVVFRLSKFDTKSFLYVQSFLGRTKHTFDFIMHFYSFGKRHELDLINPDFFIEYSKRSFLFLSYLITKKSNLLFVMLDTFHRNLFIFFCLRSLESFYYGKWVCGMFTNRLVDKFHTVILQSDIVESNLLKECFLKFIPVIMSNYNYSSLNRLFYFVPSGNPSVEFFYFFYTNLSNLIIVFKLFEFCRSL